MIVMYYGLYDQVAKEFINIFTSKNDETAQRAAHYVVRAQDFDRIAGRDYVIQHIFDIDTQNGVIVNNDVRFIVGLASALDAYLVELKEAPKEVDKHE